MNSFDQKLSNLDTALFEKIESQSTIGDKQSLLACQLATRELVEGYNYLEIGSYLGGSLQPYLLDEKCNIIYSIDKRPEFQPDERGVDYNYQNNSTQRMLEKLKAVDEASLSKIKTIDGDTRSIDAGLIKDDIQLCFVDGEHTNEAAFSDFKFCLNVLQKSGGAIIFHDAAIVYNGLINCIEYLKSQNIKFKAYNLPNIVFVIEIGDFPLHKNSQMFDLLMKGHESYLFSLNYNDYYRVFSNKTPFRLYRKLITKVKGLNKFD